jgi:ABC-type sugar transport system ATPase subunit
LIEANFSSGCGKTTLLNVLAHREVGSAAVEQTRLVNGKQIDLQDLQKISRYVEQEDALLGALTVKETLYFAAQLSLPWYELFEHDVRPLPNKYIGLCPRRNECNELRLFSRPLASKNKPMSSSARQFAKALAVVKSEELQSLVNLSQVQRSSS